MPAFICGLCSGPVAAGLGFLAGANHLDETTKEHLAMLALVIPHAVALAFGCIVRAALPLDAPTRMQRMANAAIIAPLAWAAVIAGLVMYMLSQCC